MTLKTRILAAGIILAGGVAFASGDAADPTVKARQDLMKTIGMNVKVLGDMAGGKATFDAAAAEAAKAALIAAAAEIPVKFEPEASDPASEAKAEIWTSWDDFVAKAAVLKAAAEAADVASLDAVKAGMGGIGGACKDCHTNFRVMK